MGGCSAAAKKEEQEKEAAQQSELQAKIDSLEAQLKEMTGKFESMKAVVDNLTNTRPADSTGVVTHPSTNAGKRVETQPSAHDPESGFIQDHAVQSYRQAIVLLKAGKFAESILTFSSFLEQYPDHALAGSAQYHIGNAYFQQKQYEQAAKEFEKVLTSYDRSPHIADTLRQLAEAEEALNKNDQAARHRQLLSSLFPQTGGAPSPEVNETPDTAAAAPAARKLPPPANLPAPEGSEGHLGADLDPPPTAPIGANPLGGPLSGNGAGGGLSETPPAGGLTANDIPMEIDKDE